MGTTARTGTPTCRRRVCRSPVDGPRPRQMDARVHERLLRKRIDAEADFVADAHAPDVPLVDAELELERVGAADDDQQIARVHPRSHVAPRAAASGRCPRPDERTTPSEAARRARSLRGAARRRAGAAAALRPRRRALTLPPLRARPHARQRRRRVARRRARRRADARSARRARRACPRARTRDRRRRRRGGGRPRGRWGRKTRLGSPRHAAASE